MNMFSKRQSSIPQVSPSPTSVQDSRSFLRGMKSLRASFSLAISLSRDKPFLSLANAAVRFRAFPFPLFRSPLLLSRRWASGGGGGYIKYE